MTAVSTIPQDEIGAIHHATAAAIRRDGWFRCGCCYRWLPSEVCSHTIVIEHDDILLPYAVCDGCIDGVEAGRVDDIRRIRFYVVGASA